MRSRIKPVILSVFLTCIFYSFSASDIRGSAPDDSLRFEVLLSGQLLKATNTNEKFISNIEITPNRFVLLSSDNQFYLLGWGGIQPLGNKTRGKINSYAFTSDKLLMVSQENELCGMDSSGNLTSIFNLPDPDMGIISGKYAMYVYDRSPGNTGHSVYMVTHGGHAKLFEVPTQINSVVESGNDLLLASGNAVFRYSHKDKEFRLYAALPEDQTIRSLAIDTAGNRLYFSTDNMIYGLKESKAVIVTDQFGGLLRYFNGGLIVFNPEKNYMIRILGIEDDIAVKRQKINTDENTGSISGMVTNSMIVNLVKAKVTDEDIIDLINISPVNFNTSVDSMIYLSNQNVSSQIILAMRNAVRTKGNSSTKTDSSTENKPSTNIEATPRASASETNILPVHRFYIITGSYPTEIAATEAVGGLKSKGFAGATVVGMNTTGSYRIACGSYATNEEALKELPVIKQTLNSSAWILEKK